MLLSSTSIASSTLLATSSPIVQSIFKQLSTDFVFLITLFVVTLIYALYFGRGRVVALILAFYPAMFFFRDIPFMSHLVFAHGESGIAINKLAIFLLILIPINIIICRYVQSLSEFFGAANIIRSIFLALSVMILVMVITYSSGDYVVFHHFSPPVDMLFNTTDKLFYWSLAPIALLTFL